MKENCLPLNSLTDMVALGKYMAKWRLEERLGSETRDIERGDTQWFVEQQSQFHVVPQYQPAWVECMVPRVRLVTIRGQTQH